MSFNKRILTMYIRVNVFALVHSLIVKFGRTIAALRLLETSENK